MPVPKNKRQTPSIAGPETVQISVILSPDDANFLLEGWTYANRAVAFCVRTMRILLSDALIELQGFFTPNEWEFMALALQGVEGLDDMREAGMVLSKSDLCRVLLQARHLPARATLCDVQPSELVKRIREQLSPLHVWAIRKRVRDMWRTEGVDMSQWCRY